MIATMDEKPALSIVPPTIPPSPQHHGLERLTSMQPVEGGIEPAAAQGITMMVHADHPEHGQYLLKRLRIVKPLPGKTHQAFMLAVLFLVMFLAGWNDGSQGPLLPSLQDYYGIDYLIISIIWIFNCIGFMASGILNVFLTDRFGFGIVAPFGAAMQALGYVLMCFGGPYPVFCFAFVINGFGLGLQDAQVNSLVSRLPGANYKMFLMHAVYGLGATVSPLVSTEFVKQVQSRVYLYYCVSLGLALVTVAGLLAAFQLRTDDQVVGMRQPDAISASTPPETASAVSSEPRDGEADVVAPPAATTQPDKPPGEGSSGGKMKRILKSSAVHFMAFYIMIYVGVEVTIGGWATSFIIDERGGNSSAGYVSSGYFGGLTLGRVMLIPVTALVGRQNAIYVYTVIAIGLEIVVWLVKSIIGDALAYSFVGFFLGPLYPIVMMVVTEIIPGELQSGTIGWIASLGQVGSAMMPFIAGGISQRFGVWILQPLMVSFMGASLILWALVPRSRKRISA